MELGVALALAGVAIAVLFAGMGSAWGFSLIDSGDKTNDADRKPGKKQL